MIDQSSSKKFHWGSNLGGYFYDSVTEPSVSLV